jgi:hypothetical protein
LTGLTDPDLLDWAAQHKRIVLTHDVNSMIGFAYDRVNKGLLMPGIVEVARMIPMGQVIDDILLIAIASFPEELEGRVIFLPL